MKSIWNKEFIKLNKPLAVLLLIHICVAVYHWLRIRGAFTMVAPVGIWSDIIEKNAFFFDRFEIPLLVSALALGILQFYPEVSGKRFRISCHLPMNEYIMTASMVIFGIFALTALWLVDLTASYFVGRIYFPREIYSEIPVIMFYWYIKALIIYALASVLTLEPSWVHKAVLGVMLAAFVNIIRVSVYNSDRIYLPVIVGIAFVFLLIIYYPALRFRKGE